ncbi:MAG: amidohydrolase family protein [Gemmatimonadales bacterium]
MVDALRARRLARSDALLFGALKNLLGGVTTVVHHDAWESDFTHTFPVRVARVRTAHSLRFEPDLAAVVAGTLETAQAPLCLHVAEGTTRAMADEVRTLDAMHLLDARLIAVHAVGVDEDGATRLARAGAACVWCPSSNRFLFGHTIPPGLARAKLDILLGTDSLLTGDGTLLDELRLARRLGILDDGRLRDAVGATAARRLSLPAPSLAPGAPADLVVLQRPLFEARPADVALVLVHGQVQLADEAFADLFARQGRAAERLEVGGVMKVVARPLGTVARRVADLTPECARVFS